MPNVTWQEPQVIVDLLAICLLDDEPELPCVAIVSPWFSNVEITLRPGPWYRGLRLPSYANAINFRTILLELTRRHWGVHVVVLKFGHSARSGLQKAHHSHEAKFLRELHSVGAKVHQIEDLHAKGIVTPYGALTGSTNYTKSGIYRQLQNALYFSWEHDEYNATRSSLLSRFDCRAASNPP